MLGRMASLPQVQRAANGRLAAGIRRTHHFVGSAAQQRYRASSAQAEVASTAAGPRPSWDIRMLYDGDCPLCMKEVNFLRSRDAGKGRIDFVDIASPSYDPADNAGISFEKAMERIHAITADGDIITDVEVFRRLYEAVGLGWVYAITKVEAIGRAADAVYAIWAKYRMEVTGREALSVILEKRRLEREGRDAAQMCREDAAACEVPSRQ